MNSDLIALANEKYTGTFRLERDSKYLEPCALEDKIIIKISPFSPD